MDLSDSALSESGLSDSPGASPSPTPPIDARFGTHAEALYNSQAGGVTFGCAALHGAVSAVATALVAFVCNAPQDERQIQPAIAPIPAVAYQQPFAVEPADQRFGTHAEATYNAQAGGWIYSPPQPPPAITQAPVKAFFTRAGDQLDQTSPSTAQGLGASLPRPLIRPFVAAPQDDPSQIAPEFYAPLSDTLARPPLVQWVAKGQEDPSQPSAVLRAAYGYTLAAPVVRPVLASPQADPTQLAAQFQAPTYAQQIITTPPPPVGFVARAPDDLTTPAPIARASLGDTLARPPIFPWTAAPQADPTQVPARVWGPSYAQQIELVPPAVFVVGRGQDDTSQVQAQIRFALGYTRAAPVVTQFVAAPQQDPTQPPAQFQAALGSSLAPAPIRSFVCIPQDNVSQIAPIVSPGLGFSRLPTPIVSFVAAQQADPTQIQALVISPNYGEPAQIVSSPQPPNFLAYQVDTTQIAGVVWSPNYAVQIPPSPPSPGGLSPLDPRVIARDKRQKFGVKWGFEEAKQVVEAAKRPEKQGKRHPEATKPSGLLLKLFGRAGIGIKAGEIGQVLAEKPLETATKPALTTAENVPRGTLEAKKEAPVEAPKTAGEDRNKARLAKTEARSNARIAALEAEIARITAHMREVEDALQADLDATRRLAAEHADRARAAENETTRQMAKRVEEARAAEEDLRRARNNLIAIQAAIATFFSDDEA
jgi:hypothetical protein